MVSDMCSCGYLLFGCMYVWMDGWMYMYTPTQTHKCSLTHTCLHKIAGWRKTTALSRQVTCLRNTLMR